MSELLLAGNPPIAITLRRSARARRLSLRISQLDGRVTLTLPTRVSLDEGYAFLSEKRDWIEGHLAKQPAQIFVTIGSHIPVEGHVREIRSGGARGIRLTEDALTVAGHPDTAGLRIQAILKQLARDRLAAASDRYASKLGAQYTKLTLRDTRSRWGSCTSTGGLMYSWRLVMAPPKVLDYVAAHEVAHLRHMDHSEAFWSVVRDLFGDHHPQRAWLRREGVHLHRYRFGA